MSYETGASSGRGDLFVKWFNFLQANGWTADVDWVSSSQSPSFGIINRKVNTASPEDQNTVNLHCAFVKAGTDPGGGGLDITNMIPMREYTSGSPELESTGGTQPFDRQSASYHVLGNWPELTFEQYWFFESDYYAHAVVEYKTGFFRHFGMGQLNKIGKWIGGEYYYNGYWSQSVSTIDDPLNASHRILMDGLNTQVQAAPIMYGKLIDGQPFPHLQGRNSPDSFWHAMNQNGDAGAGSGEDNNRNDRGGLTGNGARGGMNALLQHLGQIGFNGYRPMHPITLFSYYSFGAPDDLNPLGTMPDVRYISMEGALSAGDEFTVGSDTWKVFPVCRKRPVKVLDNTEQSLSMGIAYKKVLV